MSANYSLFSTKSNIAGYRLHKVEVYNWGTFHNEIYNISPDGNTSLLTGKNGSGKTTYIEALLTLLVPEGRKRTYNLVSGQKGERTEESYVLGEYGTAENEDGKFTERHRNDKNKAVSVILAVFKNEERYVTLLQVRWFLNNEMKRNYLIAHKELSIGNDVFPFDSSGNWKRNLKKKYPKLGNKEFIIEFDGPAKYAEGVRKIFGMREKALTLFSQMVGLKVLGNLDEFIRTNMLEESKIENDFQNLRIYYQKLLEAHRNIEKVKIQLELLKPIKTKSEEIKDLNNKLENLELLKQTCPIYFSQHKIDFLNIEIQKTEEELERIRINIQETTDNLSKLREEEKELDYAIRNDETGKRIQNIDKEIRENENEKKKRDAKLKKYNEIAGKINFSENPDEKTFYEQVQKAKERQQSIKIELNDKEKGLHKRLRNTENERDSLNEQYKERENELFELRKQKNNITGRVSEIRQEILAYTGADEKEIPFIGELISVLPSEKAWEISIEKTLHNFALRLIVPEKYYKSVNEYVNENNLNGRIIYERFKNETFLNQLIPTDSNSIYTKVEIRRDSLYADWLENQLKTNYNFICTDKAGISDYEKAITQQGLIRNKSKHEKDDRPHILSSQNFVLGWDTKEKIKILREILIEIENQIKEKKENIRLYERQIERLEKESENLVKFIELDSYNEIDIQTIIKVIINLQKQKDELEKTNDKVKKLKEQLNKLQLTIDEKDNEKGQFIKKETEFSNIIQNYSNQKSDNESVLMNFKELDLLANINYFRTEFVKQLEDLSFKNINQKQNSISSDINISIGSKSSERNIMERQLQTLMNDYKKPEKIITDKFPDWTSETLKLATEISYVEEDYISIYNRIKSEELANYENEFKKYLNEDMITQMTNFSTLLETREEDIKDSIEALNEPLRKIKFNQNPQTFIKLYANPINAGNIREFKIMLRDWKPNQAEYERTKDESILETSFLKIKALIDKLTVNETWRKEVTDVRNWLTFIAKEHYFDDEKRPPRNVYVEIAKLSSGEQAQITYTIMGAAIAYQYGILKDGLNANSFRFICVDEAFAKQDEEKAIYLMDLIQKLNLQMLLVTPDDKIHIAEPFISAVHIVHRMSDRTSRIFDTTIEKAKKLIKETETI